MTQKKKVVTLQDCLPDEGMYEEITAQAIAETVAWMLHKHLTDTRKTKTALARELATSRSQLDKLLNPESGHSDIKLTTLLNIGKVMGKELKIEFT